ncbi:MAG: hypothetical protein EON61_13155 [Alphaproteobacteria bacterium]|nr:MAG: hypothetical protein EON61_13155 [Alphaproteobacteria bacterium]
MTNALIPPRIRHLWDNAITFITDLLTQFDRDDLRTGLRRAPGARLSILIANAEGAFRRLILMAALAFTPKSLKPHRQTPTERTTKDRPRSFRIFSLHGSGARTHTTPPPRQPTPYGHIIFPADPILALGRVPLRRPTHRHNGGPILPRHKAKHPLDRWVRLSRNDPDWRPPPERDFVDPQPDYDVHHALWSKGWITETWLPNGERLKRKKPLRLDSTPDWRRCYDEWNRLVPAPNLAARLDALARATANPDALIQRTARRLQSGRERTIALARTARPISRLPRLARKVETGHVDMGLAPNTHGHLDSS